MVLPLFTRPTAPRLATGDSIDQVDTNHPLDNLIIRQKARKSKCGFKYEQEGRKKRRQEEMQGVASETE
jgi:hypothetical protein